MAQKPDGKSAKTERVTFTRPAAERIAKVVREVEAGDRDQAGLTFGNRFPQQMPRQVRAATFTGSWSIGNTNTVTFKAVPTVTAVVQNLSWPIAFNHTTPENCIVGKDGTSWWLVVPVLQTATAVFVTQTSSMSIVTDVNISATLNTTSCAITVGKTVATSTISVISQSITAAYLKLRVT